MGKINIQNIGEVKKQQSAILHKLIKQENWNGLAELMNRICNTIPMIDEIVGSEFINAVLKEATDEYGVDEYVSGGALYLEDFKPLEITEKEVITTCGSKVTVKVTKCHSPYDSQVMDNYYDYLTLNSKKVLSVTITQEELTRRACGLDTYNKLRELIIQKATQSVTRFLRDKVFCLLNDSRNYKQIVEIPYACDDCDGDNILSAITRFSSKLQLNAKDYNLAGRDYEVARKTGMWLVKSTDLEAKLSNVMASKFNSTVIDIDSKFARVFEEPKLTIADGVIMDKQWLQVKQVMQRIYWDFNSRYLNECGNYHYWIKDKAINFMLAVPFRLVKVEKSDVTSSNSLDGKIRALTDELTVTGQPDAESKIKALIDELNVSEPKLVLEYTFTDFIAPDEKNNGSIKVSVDIKNKNGTLLNTTNKLFVLKKN